jgi:acyl-CoA hydrolase
MNAAKFSHSPEEHSRYSSTISTRKIVAPENLNPNGTLFGGALMSWIDEIAFMCARRYSGNSRCVTVNIDNISFRMPIRSGEHVILTSSVVSVGKTSMEIEVDVSKELHNSGEIIHTNKAYLTFVSLNEKSKPISVPKLKIENESEFIKNQQSLIRKKVRLRLKNFFDSKMKNQVYVTQKENSKSFTESAIESIFAELSKYTWLSKNIHIFRK